MKKIQINEENQNQRLDKFLAQEFFLNEEISRGDVVKLIKDEKVLVNDSVVKPSYPLALGDIVEILNEIKKETELVPNEKIKIDVIFENDDFLVLNKQAGISVHPASFSEESTLVNGLLAKFPEITEVGEDRLRPGIVHRLDKETSGVLLVAKNQKTFDELKRKFQSREIEKKYLAIVWGHISPKSGVIEKPIARASSYKKQVIAGGKTKTKVRSAITHYKVLESFSDFDLVEAMPKTGRMHQIRVHLFSLGHPILGDRLYKSKKYQERGGYKQHFLHAKEIKFSLFGENYIFEAPLPEYFNHANFGT